MSISRILSLLVAGIYILIAYFGGKAVEGFRGALGIAFLLGLPCIWFAEQLGEMVGYLGHARISSTTPGGFVKFIGWLILIFLPVLAFMLQKHIESW